MQSGGNLDRSQLGLDALLTLSRRPRPHVLYAGTEGQYDKHTVTMEYDGVGNRKSIATTYANLSQTTSIRYFAYDEMNRQTVAFSR